MATRTSTCPSCDFVEERTLYDIGSGPELSCWVCEWCWGADGQDLKPLVPLRYLCPSCGSTSHHPEDIKNSYCGRCHKFEDARIDL